MSDATDVMGDTDDGYEERPSFLPPPTFPAAMMADDDSAAAEQAPAPMSYAAPADEKPEKPGFLIRLGHVFCGSPNGARQSRGR